MSCVNNCTFTGRLVAEPDFRTTQSGKSVCKFAIAVENGWGDKKEMCYPELIAWNGQADFASRLSKGTMVAAVTRMKQRSYEDKQGNKRRAIEFTVVELQALEPKSRQTETIGADEPAELSTASSTQADFESVEDDDNLPF